MKRSVLWTVIVPLALCVGIIFACGENKSPLSSGKETTGAPGNVAFTVTYAPWKTLAAKAAGAEAIDRVTAYIYDTDGEEILSADLTLEEGRAKGSLTVPSQENLRVALAFYSGETILFLGEDTDVDVPERSSATADITAHYMGAAISAPDTAIAGKSYALSWMRRPFAESYSVEEASESDFSDSWEVYSGPDTTCVIDPKSASEAGTAFYYRVSVVTQYGRGPWHGQGKTGIAGSGGTVVIDIPLPSIPSGDGITLYTPNGGETWPAWSTHAITWTSAGIDRVNIEYSSTGGLTWLPVATEVAAAGGTYAWKVADSPSSTCLVRITDSANPETSVTSRAMFTISSREIPEKTWIISGTAHGAEGSTVVLSGNASGTRVVQSIQGYSFVVNEGGPYTVTLLAGPGRDYFPSSKTFSWVTYDQHQNFIPVTMASIPGGSFTMGSSSTASESPEHTVTVSPFLMSAFEITQEQYQAVTGTNPSSLYSEYSLPQGKVSWMDAARFCNTVSRSAGLEPCYNLATGECDFSKNGYRLPTEAEWEYACRAGTTTRYHTGDAESDLALAGWYLKNSGGQIKPVGRKTPNAWGLYDMHGNLAEWCNDWDGAYLSGGAVDPTGPSLGSKRIFRGGSATLAADFCTVSTRRSVTPDSAGESIGFRVVRRQ